MKNLGHHTRSKAKDNRTSLFGPSTKKKQYTVLAWLRDFYAHHRIRNTVLRNHPMRVSSITVLWPWQQMSHKHSKNLLNNNLT